jgi:hypothetical protein
VSLQDDYNELLGFLSDDEPLAAALAEVRHYRELAEAIQSQLDACMEEKNALIRTVTAMKKREAARS